MTTLFSTITENIRYNEEIWTERSFNRVCRYISKTNSCKFSSNRTFELQKAAKKEKNSETL